jgi:hypothetical protein
LDELERIGAVTVDGEYVRLRASKQLRKRHDFGFLTAVVPTLIDGLRIAATTKANAGASIHRLVLPVGTELDLAFVRHRCATTAKAMLEGLSHSLGTKVTAARGKSKAHSSFGVTVLLVENYEKKTQREPRRISKRVQHG